MNADEEILLKTLKALVSRCDGPDGVRADGSNIPTDFAHTVLAQFEPCEHPETIDIEAYMFDQRTCVKCGKVVALI